MGRLTLCFVLFTFVLSGCSYTQKIVERIRPQSEFVGPPEPIQKAEEKIIRVPTNSTAKTLWVVFEEMSAISGDEAELAKLTDRVAGDFKKSPTLNNRLRYALVLAQQDVEAQEKARNLLNKVPLKGIKSAERDGMAGFVLIVNSLIEHNQLNTQKNADLSAELEGQKALIGQLEEQITALKSIDKSIYERESNFVLEQ